MRLPRLTFGAGYRLAPAGASRRYGTRERGGFDLVFQVFELGQFEDKIQERGDFWKRDLSDGDRTQHGW